MDKRSLVFFLFFILGGIEPRALSVPSMRCSTIGDLYPKPHELIYIKSSLFDVHI